MFNFIDHLYFYCCEWLCRNGPECTTLTRAYDAVKMGLHVATPNEQYFVRSGRWWTVARQNCPPLPIRPLFCSNLNFSQQQAHPSITFVLPTFIVFKLDLVMNIAEMLLNWCETTINQWIQIVLARGKLSSTAPYPQRPVSLEL